MRGKKIHHNETPSETVSGYETFLSEFSVIRISMWVNHLSLREKL